MLKRLNYRAILIIIVGMNIPTISLLSVLILLFFEIFYYKISFKIFNFNSLVIIGFLFLYYFAYFNTDYSMIIQITTYFTFYLSGYNSIKEKKIKSLLYPAIGLTLFFILSYFNSINFTMYSRQVIDFWRDTYINGPMFGLIGLLIVPFSINYIFYNKENKLFRFIIISSGLIVIIANVYLLNRLSILIIISTLFIMLFNRFKHATPQHLVTIYIIVSILLLLIIPGFLNNYGIFLRFSEDGLKSTRMILYDGFFSGYDFTYLKNDLNLSSYHNLFLQIYVDVGLLSFILILFIFLKMFYKGIKNYSNKYYYSIIYILLPLIIFMGALSESINLGFMYYFGIVFYYFGYLLNLKK